MVNLKSLLISLEAYVGNRLKVETTVQPSAFAKDSLITKGSCCHGASTVPGVRE